MHTNIQMVNHPTNDQWLDSLSSRAHCDLDKGINFLCCLTPGPSVDAACNLIRLKCFLQILNLKEQLFFPSSNLAFSYPSGKATSDLADNSGHMALKNGNLKVLGQVSSTHSH